MSPFSEGGLEGLEMCERGRHTTSKHTGMCSYVTQQTDHAKDTVPLRYSDPIQVSCKQQDKSLTGLKSSEHKRTS